MKYNTMGSDCSKDPVMTKISRRVLGVGTDKHNVQQLK